MIEDAVISAFPASWRRVKLGSLVWVRARLGWKGLTADEYVDSGIPMLATPNIKGAHIDFASANRITAQRYEESPEIKLRVGDVLLTKDGSTIGIANVVRSLPEPATVNGSIAVLTPNDRLDSAYLLWLLQSNEYQALMRSWQDGMGVPHLFQSDIKRIPVALPSTREQRAIADYLDRETAQIDAFIAKNEELITLLTERRAATISELVLRGTSPTTPLRESGVDGMGMVPVHWGTQPIVTLARVLTSTVDKKSYPGETPVKLCNYTDVYYSDTIRSSHGLMDATATRDQIARFSVLAGDVPFTKDSESSDDIGISSYVDRDLPGVVYGYHLGIYRPTDPRRSKYIKYLLDTAYVKDYFVRRTPGVTRVGLGQSVIRYLRAPVPPADEAVEIADEIERVVGRIDSSLALVREGISLARERRAALISAAVTGKIDVGVAA